MADIEAKPIEVVSEKYIKYMDEPQKMLNNDISIEDLILILYHIQ
jgi:hypothetical protein